MKTFFLLPFLIMISIVSSAQNCEQIKAENIKLKAELAQLKSNESVVATPLQFVVEKSNGIDFKILSVIGNKKEQTVTVSILVTNHNANFKSYNTSVSSFIGPDGDEFRLESAKLGNGISNFVDLYTDTPLKTTYVFKGVLPKVNQIKLLPFPYRNATGSVLGTIEFRDLLISWK